MLDGITILSQSEIVKAVDTGLFGNIAIYGILIVILIFIGIMVFSFFIHNITQILQWIFIPEIGIMEYIQTLM